MAFVYILESLTTGRFYIGSAVDLDRRLSEHDRRHSPYTRSRGPWKLVYKEQFSDLVSACARERKLKSWKSHKAMADLIATSSSVG
jgi:putative endonuclease